MEKKFTSHGQYASNYQHLFFCTLTYPSNLVYQHFLSFQGHEIKQRIEFLEDSLASGHKHDIVVALKNLTKTSEKVFYYLFSTTTYIHCNKKIVRSTIGIWGKQH